MRRNSHGPRARLTMAGAAGLFSLLFAASACAQGGGGDAGAAQGAQAATQADSTLARADRGRAKGAENAPVTIIEVSDFQCPYCRQWVEESYAKLDSAYVRPGKVRFIFIHYPIPSHRQAYAASEATLCAAAQGRFWPMHDSLFATQRQWNGQADAAQRFAAVAAKLDLDVAAWRECVDKDRVAPLIVNDVMQATGAGVQGTPTFIMNGGKVLSGAVPFAEMAREIDALLAQQPGQAPPPAQSPPTQRPQG